LLQIFNSAKKQRSQISEKALFSRKNRMETLDRITINQEVMGGKPCIRGMRVTVGTVVGMLAAGKSES